MVRVSKSVFVWVCSIEYDRSQTVGSFFFCRIRGTRGLTQKNIPKCSKSVFRRKISRNQLSRLVCFQDSDMVHFKYLSMIGLIMQFRLISFHLCFLRFDFLGALTLAT